MREILAAGFLALSIAVAAPGCAEPARGPLVLVERVIDGDTFDARDGDRRVRVRLIGIDTPELHDSAKRQAQIRRGWDAAVIARLARAAHAAARRLLDGRRVRLEFDVERRDRYGRLLAYVWQDDLLVNAELLRQGHARRLTIPPNVRYADRFGRLEAEARAGRRGLWAAWPPTRARRGGASSRTPARESTRASGSASAARGTAPAWLRRARSTASASAA